MCFSIFTESIWIDYLENMRYQIARERRDTMSKCSSKYHYATFFAASVCSNWKLHGPNTWSDTHCQPFLQSVNATFSQFMRLFWRPCGILYIKQRKKTSEQLARSFNWLQIFFWPNVNRQAVIFICATRERIVSLLLLQKFAQYVVYV